MKEENVEDFNLMMKARGSTSVGRLADIFFRYSTNIVLTRILGAEVFGIFILGRTVVLVISMICSLGMGYGVVRQLAFYAAQKDEAKWSEAFMILRFSHEETRRATKMLPVASFQLPVKELPTANVAFFSLAAGHWPHNWW